MSREFIGLILAGIIPAIMFSAGGLFQKLSMKKGATYEYSTAFMAVGMLIACVVFFLISSEKRVTPQAALSSMAQGMVFAVGVGLVSFGMLVYNVPLSKIVPLHTLSILITTIASLILFKESETINVVKLIMGLILVLSGVFLVIKS